MADIEEILDAYKKKLTAICRKSVHTMDSDPGDEKEALYEMVIEAVYSVLKEETEGNPALMAEALTEARESLLESLCTNILLLKKSTSICITGAAIESNMKEILNENCARQAKHIVPYY